MFLCEFCGKNTGGGEPTPKWTITETFADLTLEISVTANKKLCDACIKSFVVTKTEIQEAVITPPEHKEPDQAPPPGGGKKRGKK